MEQLIIHAMENLDEDQVLKLVRQALNEEIPPTDIINYVKSGVDNVGKRFESGEYFIADLMMAGIIFKQILAIDQLKLIDESLQNYNYTILLGTVYEDLHDIGKDIFGSMAKASGFQVIDIGIDVSARKFSDYIIKLKPDIVAMSGVLRSSATSMAEIVKHLTDMNLRDSVKIIVGGSFLTKEANNYIQADAFTRDATEGVKICQQWMKQAEGNKHD